VTPQVIGTAGCVWQPRGDGGFYYPGEQLTVCYWVTQPMNVHIWTQTPTGATNAIVSGFDDGRGGCTRTDTTGQLLRIGNTRGLRTINMYSNNQLLDTHTYNVP
jgi:hypothetical protein